MTTFSHLLAGYVATSATKKIWAKKLSEKQTSLLILYGTALSVAIDLDVLWSPGRLTTHHREAFHLPVFWFAVAAVIAVIAFIKKSHALYSMSGLTAFLPLIHLFFDAFGVSVGIHPFAPFNWYEFSFTTLTHTRSDPVLAAQYAVSQPLIVVREIIVIGGGLTYAFFNREEIKTIAKVVKQVVKGTHDKKTATRTQQSDK